MSDMNPKNDQDNTLKADPKKKPESAHVPLNAKEEVSEFVKTAIIAVILAMIIRTFLYEPFNIPSGSMFPTLKVGDYLFVSKPAYGYSKHSFPFGLADFEGRMAEKLPKRGDVAVFKLPTNPSVDYIKRIVGMPGETVQVIKGRLYIDGVQVEREFVSLVRAEGSYEETDAGPLDDTELFTVPPRHYFVMGDNRDNSQDSRVTEFVGPVPFENLVGRADILFFSAEEAAVLFNPLTWFQNIRYNRILNRIGPIRPKEETQ